jgi:VWFA-related protein
MAHQFSLRSFYRSVGLTKLKRPLTFRATTTWFLVFAGGLGLCAARTLPGQAPATLRDPNLVEAFLTVRDSSGALVTGLTKNDFLILGDGRPQSILALDNATAGPLTLCLMFETTSRMQASLQSDKAASLDLVRKFSSTELYTAVVSFESEVTLEQALTGKIDRLQRAMDSIQIRQVGRPNGLIYDAVYATASDLLEKQEGLRVMLIFTSGVDDVGKEKLDDAIHAVEKAGTLCYVINHLGPWSSTRISQDMKSLAESTGGNSITVRAGDILNSWENTISAELRGQYVVTYKTDAPNNPGTLRRIEIRMKDRNLNYSIHTRNGYFAPPN